MTGGPADAGRAAVYAAEDAAFGGTSLDEILPIADLVRAAATVTDGEWWRSAGGPTVRVTAARRGAESSSARASVAAGGLVEVRLAAGQQSVATLAHELAHALAGVAHVHDATFRAALVDISALLADRDLSRQLVAAYRDLGVPAGSRRWPSPVRVIGDGFVVVPR